METPCCLSFCRTSQTCCSNYQPLALVQKQFNDLWTLQRSNLLGAVKFIMNGHLVERSPFTPNIYVAWKISLGLVSMIFSNQKCWEIFPLPEMCPAVAQFFAMSIPIGSMYGIYANIWGILMVNVTIYSSTMDPMGIGPFHRIFAPSSTKTLRCTARATAALRASRYHGILPVSRRAAVKTRGMLRDPKNNAFEGNPGSSNLCIEIFAHLIICCVFW